jgi:hypothetical protein
MFDRIRTTEIRLLHRKWYQHNVFSFSHCTVDHSQLYCQISLQPVTFNVLKVNYQGWPNDFPQLAGYPNLLDTVPYRDTKATLHKLCAPVFILKVQVYRNNFI